MSNFQKSNIVSEEDQKNGRKRLACNKNDIYFENFVCCCNMADKVKLFAEDYQSINY